MKKTTTSLLSLILLLIGIVNTATAQSNRRTSFRIDAPANIAAYQITSEATSASSWASDINGKWENVPVAFDPNNANGCGAFTPGFFTGKFALIYRGGCEFGAKALAAQTAGAQGVIIVNNLLGVAGMNGGANGLNVTIPVIMVTTEAGNNMKTELLNNVPVTVSLAAWRFDSVANPIDIGFMSDGPNLPIAKTLPASQLSTQGGFSDDSFRVFTGGRFYNYSVVNFDTIGLEGRFAFNPSYTGGTFTQTDSNMIRYYFNTPIATTDSILYLKLDTINNNLVGFDMNDAAKGRYRMENTVYTIPFTETGSAQLNNVWTYDFAVTDSIYAKGAYNFTKNAPVANYYINVNASANYQWGQVYFIRNGSYEAKKAQAVIMRDVIDDSLFAGQDVLITLYDWDDANSDGVIDYNSEVQEVANATSTLTANDLVPIEGLVVTMPFNNTLAPGSPVILQAGKRYWMTIELGNTRTYAIGTDYYADYQANLIGVISRGNPLYDVTAGIMYGGGFSDAGSPSIALHMSALPVGMNDVTKFDGKATVYPNPTSDIVNVSVNMNNATKMIRYEIVDVTGKTVVSSAKSNVKSDVFTYNTSKLSNGTYFVNIKSDAGNTQLKFTVAK